ncbi:MAG: GlcG/HbpS family heme-binding protein [Candidatus Anammoxibacter sp.]
MALVLFAPLHVYADGLPTFPVLQTILKDVVKEKNGGFGLNMWATIVDRDGVVKTVVFSGEDRGDQWPGSRIISAQKANTANAFSLPSLSLSTANLFSAVQPGGSLYGLQHSNPVDTNVAYGGASNKIGTENDPMVGKKIGGVNVFGGGLALYNEGGKLLGAIGVSGDSSCADHNIAWKVRHKLKLDYIPTGVSPDKNDNIVNDIVDGISAGGWGHPVCSPEAAAIAKGFPKTHPVRSKK